MYKCLFPSNTESKHILSPLLSHRCKSHLKSLSYLNGANTLAILLIFSPSMQYKEATLALSG